MQTILAIDDERSVLESYNAILKGQFKMLNANSGPEGLALLEHNHADLVLLDLMMPGMSGTDVLTELAKRDERPPVVIVSGMNSVESAVKAMQHGAREYIIKPFDIDQLTRVVERIINEERRELELRALREAEAQSFEGLVGQSAAFREAVALARQAAASDATVLITGESGTGKDMLARAIHAAGPRAKEPFVHVSCCSLPEQLVESELFGHAKGAFTGALEKRTGKAQIAHGGSLFLDEIGEMPLPLQSKLLQVLQDSRFYPVGTDTPIDVDVRFICATNRNLSEGVKKGAFRQDLYYRINVVHIEMPPLRRRREDIGPLVHHFLMKHRKRFDTKVERISNEALGLMAGYDWPGNIREIENVMTRLMVLIRDEPVLSADHVARMLHNETRSGAPAGLDEFEGLPLQDAVARLERHLIERALERSANVQSRAAELLGTTRRILKYKMDQLGIASTGDDPANEQQEAS